MLVVCSDGVSVSDVGKLIDLSQQQSAIFTRVRKHKRLTVRFRAQHDLYVFPGARAADSSDALLRVAARSLVSGASPHTDILYLQ
jgi:hypothetical protein